MQTEIIFQYHSVGQGLFYTGAIGRFNFVYDCGTLSKRHFLASAIDCYKSNISEKKLNILTISHFHSDHVIGLDILLQNIKVETVFIPYLSPTERLIIALSDPDIHEGWYYDFLSDPVSFLLSDDRDVDRVVVVMGEEGNAEELPPESLPLRPDGVDLDKMGSVGDGRKREILENEPEWSDFADGGQLQFKKHDGFVSVPLPERAYLGWIFRFFNYKVKVENSIAQFRECIQNEGIELHNIKSVIGNSNDRKKIRGCYDKELGEKLNNTSLVLYHGPICNRKAIPESTRIDLAVCIGSFLEPHTVGHCLYHGVRSYFFPYPNPFGQFLLGDIHLNDSRYAELIKHYRNYLDMVLVGQLPHHGSRKNWNIDILSRAENCPIWVVSSAESSRFHHPHKQVILDVIGSGRQLLWSNQHRRIILEGSISVHP